MITVLVAVLRVVLAVRLLYLGRGYAAWTLPGAAALGWWGVRTGSRRPVSQRSSSLPSPPVYDEAGVHGGRSHGRRLSFHASKNYVASSWDESPQDASWHEAREC